MTSTVPCRTLRPLTPFTRRLRLPAVVIAIAASAAACGGGGSASTASGGSGGAGQPQAGASSGAGTGARPGTTGTISQVNPASIYVQNQQNGQVTVDFTSATRFTQTVTTTAASLKAGNCVTATEATPAASASPSASASSGARTRPTKLTASEITITAQSGTCTRGTGNQPGGARPSGMARPSGAPSAFPSGAARGNFRGFAQTAFGTVTSVDSGTIIVNETFGSTKQTVTVTTTPATVYRETAAASKANLKVGLCATAAGKTDDTGAVTARTIALSAATASGCQTGFGGFGGFGGMRSGQGGGTSG